MVTIMMSESCKGDQTKIRKNHCAITYQKKIFPWISFKRLLGQVLLASTYSDRPAWKMRCLVNAKPGRLCLPGADVDTPLQVNHRTRDLEEVDNPFRGSQLVMAVARHQTQVTSAITTATKRTRYRQHYTFTCVCAQTHTGKYDNYPLLSHT